MNFFMFCIKFKICLSNENLESKKNKKEINIEES